MNIYKIEKGKPADTREENENKVYERLNGLSIEYLRADHDKADTIEDCHEIETAIDSPICKNLFLCNSQKTKFYLLLMPGDKKFKTKDLSKQINSARLSFADSEYMQKYLDILPGSVSVMGIANDTENNVQLIIDEDLLKEEYLCCHPCRNTSTLKIKTSDITNVFIPYTNHNFITVNL